MPNMSDEREIIDGLLKDAEDALNRGALGKASSLYQGILRIEPNHIGALRQLAAMEVNRGDPAVALEFFERARQLKTDDADLCHGIATALRLMGRDSDSNVALLAALRIDPNHGPALYDQARRQQQEGNHKAAGDTFFKLAKLSGGSYDVFFNRGVSMYRVHNLIAAERWFHAAGQVDPKAHRPLVNLAMIYRVWGFIPQALGCLEHAVTLAPDSADAHWNLAHALLVSGELVRGFAEYEWRFKREGREERPINLPRWTGEPLDGKTILLTLEQGMGDAIQFVRFASAVAARGGRVVVECHPGLNSLLATAPGVSAVVKAGVEVPEASCYLPLMSLPHVLGTTWDNLPAQVPYLAVPPGTPVPSLEGEGLRVGMVWRGNAKHENDRWRSLHLLTLGALLEVKGVSYFGLQLGVGRDDCDKAPWTGRITDLSPHLKNFAATAAVVAEMDLIITVDTAVAHLAGALGKPVWVLIPQGNDWRWLHEREDSPWYPTLRLFRQGRKRQWAPAIRAMVGALQKLAAAHGARE